jgi:hypothetical protein
MRAIGRIKISRNRRRHLCVLIIPFLVGCSKNPAADYGGQVIAAPGSFTCFGKQLVVKVVHDVSGRLNYTVANKKAAAGPAKAAIEESSAWAIFPESPGRVWVFDGARDVTLVEIYADGSSKFTSSQIVPDLLRSAPDDFAARLPVEVKQPVEVMALW